MTTRTFVTLATLTVSLRPQIAIAAQTRPAGAPPTARATRPPLRSEELYSLHARRRFAAYLRLRLLEMRESGLVRAADVVERRLPVDSLVPPLRER